MSLSDERLTRRRERRRAAARARRRRQVRLRRTVALLVGVGVVAIVWGSALSGGGLIVPRAAAERDARQDERQGVSSALRVVPPRSAALSRNVYAATAVGRFSAAVRGVKQRVYVPNSRSGTVTVIDPTTFQIIRRFRVGLYDQHVTPSWDLRHLYVNNTASNSLTVINPRSGRPTGEIPVSDPYNLYFTPDGSSAIVVVESFHRLDFRDPHTWALQGRVSLPAAGPNHLDFSADGSYLLISAELSGHVVKVDLKSKQVSGKLFVGGSPVDVKLAPDGSVFFVANQMLGGVSVIDPQAMRQIGFIHTGAGAHGMAFSHDARRLYVSNRLAGSISVLDPTLRRLITTWKVGGSPDMIQISPDGRQLWVSNRFHGTVSVVDTSSGRLIHRIPTGNSPHGLAYFPQPGRYSLGHNGVYR